MGLNDTPRADRLHIGLFGKRNSGKSSLINALTGQKLALVSDTPGTTADPVFKAMELHPIGPVVFIDTAGFDDEGDLGELRVQKTKEILPQTDLALMVIDDESALARNLDEERRWIMDFTEKDIPVIAVFIQAGTTAAAGTAGSAAIRAELGDDILGPLGQRRGGSRFRRAAAENHKDGSGGFSAAADPLRYGGCGQSGPAGDAPGHSGSKGGV